MALQATENQEPDSQLDQIITPVSPLAKKINVEALIGRVVTREDFAEIDGKIEPTRDLALKLFTIAKLNYDTQLLNTTLMGSTILIAVKARVYQVRGAQKKVAEGLGGCSTEETARSGKRAYHDALARAETRAFKRALEAAVGLPFINQLILGLFGGYEMEEKTSGIAEERLLGALKSYIDKADNAGHLENWGRKYKPLADLLSEAGRGDLRQHYAARLEYLIGVGTSD
jgi:hemoglobin-like flavoprotein